MEEQTTSQAFADVSQEGREAVEIIKRLRDLRETGMHEETQRLQIDLDDFCRRDSADALFSHRIRQHTLIEDNPCSG